MFMLLLSICSFTNAHHWFDRLPSFSTISPSLYRHRLHISSPPHNPQLSSCLALSSFIHQSPSHLSAHMHSGILMRLRLFPSLPNPSPYSFFCVSCSKLAFGVTCVVVPSIWSMKWTRSNGGSGQLMFLDSWLQPTPMIQTANDSDCHRIHESLHVDAVDIHAIDQCAFKVLSQSGGFSHVHVFIIQSFILFHRTRWFRIYLLDPRQI